MTETEMTETEKVEALASILASLARIDAEHRFAVFNEVNSFRREVADEIREMILGLLEAE
jgi:aminoglycoside phosphotransferase (APT) family kinase protein